MGPLHPLPTFLTTFAAHPCLPSLWPNMGVGRGVKLRIKVLSSCAPSLLPGGFKPFFWNVQLCPDNISISCERREAQDLRVGKMHFSLGFSDRKEPQILMCALFGLFSWWK